MKTTYLIIFVVLFISSCGQNTNQSQAENQDIIFEKSIDSSKNKILINPDGKILETRILPPEDYQRIKVADSSFADYLRNLPLKPHGSTLLLYNGSPMPKYNVYDAIVNLDIGKKDLHQCADAVMRLRAEYLWNQKQYDKIHFNFTNGFQVNYSEWMKGKRIIVKGNKTYWSQNGSPSNTYKDFWKYMETIFNYAGTLSLEKELKAVDVNKMKIGDIFIQGDSPGHAIIVVDMAINPKTNKKLFLLAQSFMPAQEIQILKNPNNKNFSPWYSLDFGEILKTPEWTFNKTDLKRFE